MPKLYVNDEITLFDGTIYTLVFLESLFRICRLSIRTVLCSVSDPDPDWIRIQLGQCVRIRIRIREGKNDSQK